MGQAKNRGSREQRITEAKARIENIKPSSITCNNCSESISDITTLDTKGMSDIDAVFAGFCPNYVGSEWEASCPS